MANLQEKETKDLLRKVERRKYHIHIEAYFTLAENIIIISLLRNKENIEKFA